MKYEAFFFGCPTLIVYASSSFEAAKVAQAVWGLKNTLGIRVFLLDSAPFPAKVSS